MRPTCTTLRENTGAVSAPPSTSPNSRRSQSSRSPEQGSLHTAVRDCLGFTLIELLVVLTMTAVLVTVVFASLSSARERADATLCAANLHQLALANVTYAGEHDGQYVA